MMANLGDERIDPISPTIRLRPPLEKQTKGKRQNPNKDNGWQNVPNPWMHYVESQYVN
jgi:hypothetical protein